MWKRKEVNASVRGIPIPALHLLKTLKECLAFVKDKRDASSFEGLVVVDAAFNRIKIKSLMYVLAHHEVFGEMDPTARRMLTILEGEQDEVIAYHSRGVGPSYEQLLAK